MKQPLPKEHEKEIKKLADKMPVVFYTVKEDRPYTGHDLTLCGHEKDRHGKPLEADKVYYLLEDTQIAVNHFRRLKKAWYSQGLKGLQDYVARINAMVQMADNKITLRA